MEERGVDDDDFEYTSLSHSSGTASLLHFHGPILLAMRGLLRREFRRVRL